MGQQRVSNIALINIGRAYTNSVVNSDMDRIIDIFGRQNGREKKRAHMIDSYVRIFSLHMYNFFGQIVLVGNVIRKILLKPVAHILCPTGSRLAHL